METRSSGTFSFPLGGAPGVVIMVNSEQDIRFDEGKIALNMADIRSLAVNDGALVEIKLLWL